MEQSRNLASKTNEEATKADVILNDIRTSISHINDVSVNIATAAQQQSETSEEINRNTTTIRDISQEVATQAQNQSALCTGMVEIIDQQNNVLDKFKV
ncbi:MAG: methyl-accepting chemotaxis sensory transducer [Osedax symbiont Rs2]|nr:MAG: methyl-accepting chemotaxis sensory transducer [Osedax symbiont Rs2]